MTEPIKRAELCINCDYYRKKKWTQERLRVKFIPDRCDYHKVEIDISETITDGAYVSDHNTNEVD